MAGRKRVTADYNLLLDYLMVGSTVAQAASLSSMSESTAHRYLASPKGRQHLERRRSERRQQVSDLSRLLVLESLLKLRDLVNTPPRKTTRQAILSACKTVLDYESRVAAGAERLRRIEQLEEIMGGDT